MTGNSRASTPQTVLVSTHATEQYRHHVRPGLNLDAGRLELERLRRAGEISTTAPVWLNAGKHAPHYLLIGREVALRPQAGGWIATTCVTQRTLLPTRRPAKSARKMSLGAGHRARRRAWF